MITSSWGAQFMQMCEALDAQHSWLQYVVPFFTGTDVVAQIQPSFYPVTYNNVIHIYHRRATWGRYSLLPPGHYGASGPFLSQEARLHHTHPGRQPLLS